MSRPNGFERFRAALIEHEPAQAALGGIDSWPEFIERAVAIARELGVELAAEELERLQSVDPLGLQRLQAPPGVAPTRPKRGWLPMQVVRDHNGELVVDWIYFGARPLDGSFYEGDLRRVLNRPFNMLLRFRTPLGELGRWVGALPGLQPSGLIFHMSRCGSTLVSRMLAASPANIVVSEAAPIDAALQIDRSAPELLQAMVGAFGQVRGDEKRYFLKLECWHALDLPLFLRAFPSVPWVFLYRDPAEVIVSQLRQPGRMAAADVVAGLLGADAIPALWTADDHARALGAVCEAALSALPHGGGRLVNYRDLPDAFWTQILPHFGVSGSEQERGAAASAARFDAKAPWLAFATDSAAKQREVNDPVRAACARYLDEPYRRMEALRRP